MVLLGLGLETSGLGLGLGLEALGLGLEAFGLGLGRETPGLVNIPGSKYQTAMTSYTRFFQGSVATQLEVRSFFTS